MPISVDLRPLSVCLHGRTVRTECTAKRARGGGANSFGWNDGGSRATSPHDLGIRTLVPLRSPEPRSFEGGVIFHAYQRAAYTSEPTNAEAPIWAAYRLPTEYPEIGVFRLTDDSMYLFWTNASPEGVSRRRPHL